jgi:hypothetical protein
LLAFPGLGGPLDELSLAPEPGTVVTRTWSESLELVIDALDETLDGQPTDLPLGEIEIEERRTFVLEDELVECSEGRPVEILRRIDEGTLESSVQLGGQPVGTVRGGSGLADAELHFHLAPEEEVYTCTLDGEELEREVAGTLDPDLDLIGLLPADATEVGATWEPGAPDVARLFAAGGEMGFVPTEVEIEMSGAPVEVLLASALGSLHELFGPGAEVTGRAEARRLEDRTDDDGTALACVAIELSLESEIDLGERFRRCFREASPDSHGLTLAGEVEGEIELLWDRSAHHLRAARFEGDVALEGRVQFPVQPSGARNALDFVGDYELSGEATVELTVE